MGKKRSKRRSRIFLFTFFFLAIYWRLIWTQALNDLLNTLPFQEFEHRHLKTTDKIIIYSWQESTLSYMSTFQHTSRDKYSFLLVALEKFDGGYLQYMNWTNEVVVRKEIWRKGSWGFLCFYLSFLSSFRSIVFSLERKERKASLEKVKKKDDSQEKKKNEKEALINTEKKEKEELKESYFIIVIVLIYGSLFKILYQSPEII